MTGRLGDTAQRTGTAWSTRVCSATGQSRPLSVRREIGLAETVARHDEPHPPGPAPGLLEDLGHLGGDGDRPRHPDVGLDLESAPEALRPLVATLEGHDVHDAEVDVGARHDRVIVEAGPLRQHQRVEQFLLGAVPLAAVEIGERVLVQLRDLVDGRSSRLVLRPRRSRRQRDDNQRQAGQRESHQQSLRLHWEPMRPFRQRCDVNMRTQHARGVRTTSGSRRRSRRSQTVRALTGPATTLQPRRPSSERIRSPERVGVCRGSFLRASRRRVSRLRSHAPAAAAAARHASRQDRRATDSRPAAAAAAAGRRAGSSRRWSKRAEPATRPPTARAVSASTASAAAPTARGCVSRAPSRAASAPAPASRWAPTPEATAPTTASRAAGVTVSATAPARARSTRRARSAARNRAPDRR